MALPPVPAAPTLSKATSGDETELYLDVGSGWELAGEVTDLPDLPSGEQTTYETTHMRSGKFKEFKKNKRVDGTETDIVGNYSLEDGIEVLEAAEASVDAVPYLMILKEGEESFTATGHALFYSLRRSNPMEEVRQFTITAKWVTAMTLAAAA